MKIITQNKKVFHEYEIINTFEAGIVLTGNEVKSLRAGHVNLIGSFAHVHANELFLVNCQIMPYSHAYNKSDDVSRRSRKLLIHKRELLRLIASVAQKGITLLPLKLYFNEKGLVKVEIAICRHKKGHERKEEIKERDIQRETRRELKGTVRY